MVQNNPETITGRCLCGAVTYSVAGEPIIVAHCHCDDCRKLSGAGHTTGAMFADDTLILNGPVGEHKINSNMGNTVTRVFCQKCGSPILGKNTGMEGVVTLTLGTMDDASAFIPQVAVFDSKRQPWDIKDDTVERYEHQPGWKPGDGV